MNGGKCFVIYDRRVFLNDDSYLVDYKNLSTEAPPENLPGIRKDLVI